MDDEAKKPNLVLLPKPGEETEEDDAPAPEGLDAPDDVDAPEPEDEDGTEAEAEPADGAEAPPDTPAEADEPADEDKAGRPGRVAAVIFTLLLVALAVGVFVFRDRLTGENLRDLLGVPAAPETRIEAFTYEAGAGQTFAAAGNGLAVATTSSLQLLDAAGETVFKQVVSYTEPAVFGAEGKALFCDLGGTGCVVARADGASETLTPRGTLQSASMNGSGWIALATDAAGYKALVCVYDDALALRYEYWSGAGYVLSAKISPDNRLLAVLCAESGGGRLHVFRLDSGAEYASASFADALPFDLCFLGNDRLCAVGADALRFLSAEGEELGSFALGEYYLMDYDLDGGSFVTLYASAYRTGGGGLLETVDRDGRLLAYAELDRDALSLSSNGRQLLAMTANGLTVYDRSLAAQYHYDALMTAKKAILRTDGDILLLGAYSAEKLSY